MSLSVDIVKQGGRRPAEPFKRDKLHASIVAVCLSTRTPEGQADSIASIVCDEVERWLIKRQEVTSRDIRVVAAKRLANHHTEAAYLYEQHRITI